jgi:hypothetical protein
METGALGRRSSVHAQSCLSLIKDEQIIPFDRAVFYLHIGHPSSACCAYLWFGATKFILCFCGCVLRRPLSPLFPEL